VSSGDTMRALKWKPLNWVSSAVVWQDRQIEIEAGWRGLQARQRMRCMIETFPWQDVGVSSPEREG